ncbi:hypothetical protein DPMN_096292 [Dreissena polymorpha]|uniref:NADH:ubiquinone oxidoreductase intermediate-associated protein 30 domain-containing protein n=2 Tax=Dreissena polymorpha TaxID=45954 RepID=A0A9D4L822_DREPO|nr:hypothetical protein DPMN_096292 [Dreissena polymorpha]
MCQRFVSIARTAKLISNFHSISCQPKRNVILEISYCQKRYKAKRMRESNILWGYEDRKMNRKREFDAEDERTTLELISDGVEIIRKGIPEFKKEWKERFLCDFQGHMDHGDFRYFAKFNEETVKKWICTADRDVEDGKSHAEFTLSEHKKGLFRGILNTDVPKDGVSKTAGFCNISSPVKTISFGRVVPYDFTGYTDLHLRVRGDGRNYMVILQMQRIWDHLFYDMYNYPLYTHGGPYWQNVVIPFSKFVLAAAGRVQNKQEHVGLRGVRDIRDIGITVADDVPGPFKLEIDYIAVVRDENSRGSSDFDMELYATHKYDI